MAPLLDPDKQRRAYDRSCSSLNTTPKKTLFWLLLSLHILSCLSQKSNSDQIHEIFHDDLEHSIVRRDVSSDGGSQAQEVSKLALATRLNSSHLHLMVHWAGQGSPVIFVLARSQVMDSKANSKVYISRDYGKTFHEKSELFQVSTNAEDGKTSTNAVIAKFYHHPQSNCHYVFADTVNRYIFTTTDCGETIQARNLDTIHPSLIAFDKNNENVFLIHDLESPEKRLHVTRTFGQTFDQVQDYVRNFFFSKVDLGSKLFIERIQPLEEGQTEKDRRVTILAADNFFERKIDVEVVYRNAVQFQLLGDFMFVTKYRNEDDKEHMDLFISVHGERFVQARFPFSESKNFTHLDYHIIDVTDEGQIMVIVNHGPVISHLYTSTRMTPYEAEFSLSLERVMFYNPNVTWHDSWLAATAGDEPFADVYKIQGLRGIYVASQIVNTNEDSRMIEPKNLQTKISFDQGAVWIPIKGPKTDEEGRDFTDCLDADYRCNLHLSQQLSSKFPITRSIPILTSKNAIGIVMASGNMGQTLTQKNNVFVSADAGLSWHQVLKGSYFYNLGDHGGIIVAVKYFKTEGPTNELLYSTDEGLNWKSLKFYDKPLRVYGLLTEPGENTTAFTVFGTEHGVQGVDWIIVTIDLKSVFERECTVEDYKRWSPNDNTKGKHRYCLLGRKEIYERRMVKSNCYNGRDYERLISVENCLCQMNDFQCDFGFKRDSSWSNGCVLDENYHHQPYEPPARCPPGEFYNLTRGYIKIRGDSCEAGKSKVFEPQSVPCPIKEEKEFLLLSLRDRVMRINLRNFTEQEELPLENVKNVISLEYDLQDGCIFYGDTTDRKIYKQCLNGSMVETLVQKTDTVEGMSYDWISKTLYFVDGAQKTIELVRVDVKNEGHMRKTILDQQTLRKPRGLAVHPLHGYLFYSDWNEESPHIGRADMDGSNALVLFKSPIVQWPNGLSLDYVANRLYWTDAKKDMIASCLFDGSDFKIVVQNSHSLEHPFGMTVHKNLVFWDDWTHHALFLADKNTGKGSASIMTNIKGGMDVKAFSSLHRHGQNNCSSHSCSHICVPLPDDKSVCLCPDGLKAVQEEGQVSCKCPDGSDSLGNGTCAEQQNGSCMPHQYTCGNGICIPETWVCDGNNDCGDHSDEADHKCLKLQCRDTEFMCQDGSKCVPEKWKCDFDKDCPDGSDENCTHSTCAPDQFRCHNGQCISNKWQCDLEEDCTDGSDELNCTGNPDAKCKPNEFQCENSPQCFPESWKCDGDFDCPGQEDEKDCQEHKCEDWQFDCGNGQCIFKSWTCDGDKDCPSGADEANCTSAEDETNSETLFPAPFFPNATQCNEWTFRCNNGQCIPYWWKCDGTEDCSDKSDELECQDESEKDDDEHHNDDEDYDNEHNDPTWQPKCSEDKFLCPGSNDCIWEAWLCDHENDCPGGEDEAEEICANRPVCSREMFRCEKSGDCISYEQICDQKVDCSDGSDEIGCHDSEPNEHNCGPNEFPCDENNCVSDSQICDGISQCLDGTDELVCNNDHPQVLGLEVMEDTVNATSVQLDWYVPDMAHAGDYEYQPGFAPHGTEEWHWHAWQKIPETTWKFRHLRPFTTYKFRVNLRSNGIVYNGTSLAQTTTSPAIPSAPRITNVEQTNAGLVLSWTKPGATNGALKNYIIEISANESSIETVETEGPVQSYTLDTQQFNAGQKVTFRVRAVNSHFKGDFSDPKDLEIGHEILQDAISQLKIVSTADSFVTFQWSKLVPAQAESSPLFGQSWFYRVSYSILDNQFANYPDLNVTNDKESLNVTNLSPGSAYTFRFNIQLGSLSGPSVLKHVQTLGKALPRPQISKANLAPTAGTSIKLTWNKAKGQEWTYAVFYGRNIEEMITEGVRQTTTDTSLQIDRLHACESYTFVVAINGPKGMGPPSPPFSKSTKFSPGAPPKNLQATVDRTSNVIRITWNASCSVINDAIGYQLGITDKTTGSTSYVNLMRTQNTSLTHVFDKNVKYGTAYQFTVQTDDPNAQKSPKYTVKTLPIPVPAGLTTFLNVNASTHEIAWNIPNKLPSYLQKKVNAQKIQYRLFVSTDHDFKDLTLVANLSETRYKLPKDRLEPGKIYYVGVSLVDGAYVSEKAGPIPLEATIPAHDLIVSPSGMAGVLVPIFIVIAVLGSVLAYYAHRHRRLKRNFAAFASRYSPATGAAILNAASLDDDDDDSPIIRGFADDEPLVVS